MFRAAAVLSCTVATLCPAPAAAAAERVFGEAPALGWVLLAGPGPGQLRVFDVRRGVMPLATLQGARRALRGVEVDVRRRRVWVLAPASLDLHDGFSGRLLGHWAAPAGVTLRQLALDAAGQARVTGEGGVYEVAAGRGELRPAGAGRVSR